MLLLKRCKGSLACHQFDDCTHTRAQAQHMLAKDLQQLPLRLATTHTAWAG